MCILDSTIDTANVAKLLIANGANPNARDKDGESGLHVAALNGDSMHFQ